MNTGKVQIFVAAIIVLVPATDKLMSVVINRFDVTSEIPRLIPAIFVFLVLNFAWLARVVGAPELLVADGRRKTHWGIAGEGELVDLLDDQYGTDSARRGEVPLCRT